MDKKENLSQPIKQETEQRFPIFFILLMWIQPIMRMTGRSIVKGILMLIFFNFIVNRIGSQSLVIYGKLI